jgi:hypothetical protein
MAGVTKNPVESPWWSHRALLYGMILLAAAAGMLIKRPFGLFLFHLMGKSRTGPRTAIQWLMSDQVALVIVAAGCLLHRYSGLPAAPRIERLLGRERWITHKSPVFWPGIVGALVCVLLSVVSQIYQTFWGAPMPLTGRLSTGGISPDDMRKLVELWPLGVVGSALSEEVAYRFAPLSILMGVASFFRVGGREANNSVAFWIANVLQAVWFGFGHVQEGLVASQAGGLLFQTAIAPQTYSAAVFGVVYRRWGLEAAVVSHMATDIMVPIFVLLWTAVFH